MPTLAFADYRPDLSDLDASVTASLRNVLPRADGYGPMKALEGFSAALGAACRGFFFARNRDNTVTIFAATSTRLYKMSNTDFTWSDVSKGGNAYAELSADAQWQFAQFNDYVIVVQANVAPQAFDLTSDTEFDDLGGAPPQAAYVSIVNRFVVLSGLTSEPYRVQWSGLNGITTWTSGTNSSDYQDLPDGGIVRPVVGGEFGLILQDGSIRRMTFSPGSETIFDIQRLAKDVGVLAPYSVCTAGDRVFFLSPKGFMMTTGAGELVPIGEESVNRTFFEDYDASNLHLVIGAASPRLNVALFAYKSQDNNEPSFDKILGYNYVLQKWFSLRVSGQYIATLASPGLTMENLDAIAPGSQAITGAADNGSGEIRLTVGSTSGWTTGDYKTISGVTGTTEANGTWPITVVDATHIDLDGSTFTNAYVSGGLVGGNLDELEISLDAFSASALPQLAAATTSNELGFFSGDNLEAVLETPEQSGDGQRLLVRGFYPITDAGDVRGSMGRRETLNATRVYGSESTMSSDRGFCSFLRSTRYARGRIRIPAGTNWTFAKGIKPDVLLQGPI